MKQKELKETRDLLEDVTKMNAAREQQLHQLQYTNKVPPKGRIHRRSQVLNRV